MSTNSYQPTWNGSMQPNQQNTQTSYVQPQQTMQSPQWNQWQVPQYATSVIIVPIQGEEAVHNYIVSRGVTAFLIDYTNRVFWKKRQTDDGLGYETVKHYFFTEDEYKNIELNQNGSNGVSMDEFNNLKETVMKLKTAFDDLMK